MDIFLNEELQRLNHDIKAQEYLSDYWNIVSHIWEGASEGTIKKRIADIVQEYYLNKTTYLRGFADGVLKYSIENYDKHRVEFDKMQYNWNQWLINRVYYEKEVKKNES